MNSYILTIDDHRLNWVSYQYHIWNANIFFLVVENLATMNQVVQLVLWVPIIFMEPTLCTIMNSVMSKKMSYATDLTLHSRPEWPNNSFSILCIAPYICYASQAILSALNFVILFIAKIQTVFVKNAYGNQLQRTHLCL